MVLSKYETTNFQQDVEKFKSKFPGNSIYTIEQPILDGQRYSINSVVVAEVAKEKFNPFFSQRYPGTLFWFMLDFCDAFEKRVMIQIITWLASCYFTYKFNEIKSK